MMQDLANAQAASNFLNASKAFTIGQNREMGLVTRGPNSGTMMNTEGGGPIANGTGFTTDPDAINQGFNPTPNEYTDKKLLAIADKLGPLDANGTFRPNSPYTMIKLLQNFQRGVR